MSYWLTFTESFLQCKAYFTFSFSFFSFIFIPMLFRCFGHINQYVAQNLNHKLSNFSANVRTVKKWSFPLRTSSLNMTKFTVSLRSSLLKKSLMETFIFSLRTKWRPWNSWIRLLLNKNEKAAFLRTLWNSKSHVYFSD